MDIILPLLGFVALMIFFLFLACLESAPKIIDALIERFKKGPTNRLKSRELRQLDSICAATGKSREEVLREALGEYGLKVLATEAQQDGFYSLPPPSRTAEDEALKNKDKSPIEPA